MASSAEVFYPYCVPLSDRERRLLAEMEQALQADDPRLVSTLSGSPKRALGTRVIAGAGLILGGVAVIFAGLISKTTPIGVLGFLIALAGVLLVVAALNNPIARASRSQGSARPKLGQKFGDRLGNRWDQRGNEDRG